MDTVVAKAPGLLVVLHRLLEEIGRRGRPGTALMRAVLEDRPPGYVPAESGLESRFARLLVEAGEPALARQVDVGGTTGSVEWTSSTGPSGWSSRSTAPFTTAAGWTDCTTQHGMPV